MTTPAEVALMDQFGAVLRDTVAGLGLEILEDLELPEDAIEAAKLASRHGAVLVVIAQEMDDNVTTFGMAAARRR